MRSQKTRNRARSKVHFADWLPSAPSARACASSMPAAKSAGWQRTSAGSAGRPNATTTRENGGTSQNLSHVLRSTTRGLAAAATGMSRARARWAAAAAPGRTSCKGPRGPSTANAASAPARSSRTIPNSPELAPRELLPLTTVIPSERITPAWRVPSADQLTRTAVGPLRRHPSSAICVPCQKHRTTGPKTFGWLQPSSKIWTRHDAVQRRSSQPRARPASSRITSP
jgi:hypothetical protein